MSKGSGPSVSNLRRAAEWLEYGLSMYRDEYSPHVVSLAEELDEAEARGRAEVAARVQAALEGVA